MKNYDKLVELYPKYMEVEGLCEVIDLMANVYNGGIKQYIDNGHMNEIERVMILLGRVDKPNCKSLNKVISNNLSSMLEYETFKDDDEMDEYFDYLDNLDNTLTPRIDGACGEIIKFLDGKSEASSPVATFKNSKLLPTNMPNSLDIKAEIFNEIDVLVKLYARINAGRQNSSDWVLIENEKFDDFDKAESYAKAKVEKFKLRD